MTPTVSSSRKYEYCHTNKVKVVVPTKSVANSSNKLAPGDTFNPHRQFHGTWIPQWLDERPEVSERAKKLYAYLTYFAGGKGKAWPSYATLSEKLHVTRRHVIRILCELSEHRLIKVTHVNDPTRGHRANVYEFIWHVWMQHPEDKNFKMVVPEESPPEEIPNSSEDVFNDSQPSTHPGDKNVTRVVELPSTTPSDISDTRVVQQLPPSDMGVTSLVTPMSPRSQENKGKRINNYKHPKGACSSVPRQTLSPSQVASPSTTVEEVKVDQGRTHGILWQEWMRYNNEKSVSQPMPEKQSLSPTLPDEENLAKVTRVRETFPPPPKPASSTEKWGKQVRHCKHSSQANRLSEPARHSAALVRKAWQVSRKLLTEFWENCKIQPDLRILFGYVSRALREGYKEESIRDAFACSLHQCHGHATDCGKIWEASSTVHRAEKSLKANGSMWEPTPPEERRRIRAEIAAAMEAWEVQQ